MLVWPIIAASLAIAVQFKSDGLKRLKCQLIHAIAEEMAFMIDYCCAIIAIANYS